MITEKYLLSKKKTKKDHISISGCTYHRNQTLELLLKNLVLQETGVFFGFSVFVVDNDQADLRQ